jgi:tRNA (cytidine/uridine-2'-O-)-methyltransferase
MLNIALYEPEIPPNTGNIIRLSANMGAVLHLIHPLAFELSDKYLRRAGLDYHDLAHVEEHLDFSSFMARVGDGRLFACTTKGATRYTEPGYRDGDWLLFGPESRGLPEPLLHQFPAPQRIRIPMVEGSRSLNLSNAVAVIAYEAWRQGGFCGGG